MNKRNEVGKVQGEIEQKYIKKKNYKKQIILGILSFIYAVCLVFGHDIMLNYEDGVQYTDLSVWMRIISWTFIFCFAINAMFIICAKIWRGGG